MRDEGAVLYLDKINGSRGAKMRSRGGQRMPLSRTGVGKDLLIDTPGEWRQVFDADHPEPYPPQASQDFMRRMQSYVEAGVAFDLEENEVGIRCVAAPVRDASGSIVAAISLSATTPYMPPQRMRALGGIMRDAAMYVSRALGHS